MVKNELTYYYITLKGGQTEVQIGDKVVPIIGIYVSKNNLFDILSGKKIEENFDNQRMDKLSCVELRELNKKEVNDLKVLLSNLTLPEKQEYMNIMNNLEEKIKDDHFINESFGLGEIMTRRLMVGHKKNRD